MTCVRGCIVLFLALMGLCGWAMSDRATAAEPRSPHDTGTKNIVILAGKKSHGPGAHEYEADAVLLFDCLRLSPDRGSLRAGVHFNGWPTNPKWLDDADTIVLLSDGLDKPYPREQHPFLRGDHLAVIEKQVRRGCGLVLIHWPLWVPASIGREKFMPWIGGYCDYENPPGPGMSDRVDWNKQLVHPVCRGLEPFTFQDEYYPNVRFAGDDPRFTAILPFAGRAKDSVWAWTWQRADGGRSFVYVGGHAHANWRIDPLRKTILNGILWSAHAEVPAGGVRSKVGGPVGGQLGAEAVSDATSNVKPAEGAIRTLILTGHHHPGHPWRESTRAIQSVLWRDARFVVDVIDNPEFLACPHLADYQLVVLNYCNWERGGISPAARAGFLKFVSQGGGLVVSHFADGAFGPGAHPTTPEANWPEFSKLCRRAWIDGKSSHDAYGPFHVVPTGLRHPITDGLKPFDTVDELYFNQQGELPIEPLVTARSKVTRRDEPLAFAYTLGKGRVFQNLLGHAVDSIVGPGPAELLRRGAAWAAGREPVAPGGLRPPFAGTLAAAATESTSAPYDAKRMGRSLDLAKTTATVAAAPEFSRQPLTVECWARVRAKDGFQVLVSSHPKESGEHWELYTYAGSGVLSAYLPGRGGDVRSSRDITDGRWHYLAMIHEPGLVRLYVDGAEVARQEVAVQLNMPAKTGPLAIGFAYAGNDRIGCNGEIDELRISSAARKINGIPAVPFKADGQTLGLWHFDDDPQSKRLSDAAGHRHGAVTSP